MLNDFATEIGMNSAEDIALAAGGVFGAGMIGFVLWCAFRPLFRR